MRGRAYWGGFRRLDRYQFATMSSNTLTRSGMRSPSRYRMLLSRARTQFPAFFEKPSGLRPVLRRERRPVQLNLKLD